jgi:hypothetical protein
MTASPCAVSTRPLDMLHALIGEHLPEGWPACNTAPPARKHSLSADRHRDRPMVCAVEAHEP